MFCLSKYNPRLLAFWIFRYIFHNSFLSFFWAAIFATGDVSAWILFLLLVLSSCRVGNHIVEPDGNSRTWWNLTYIMRTNLTLISGHLLRVKCFISIAWVLKPILDFLMSFWCTFAFWTIFCVVIVTCTSWLLDLKGFPNELADVSSSAL